MKYAIIPAAGSGTRMKELGRNYAKTVLPYEGKPILIHIIENLEKAISPDEIIVVYSNYDHLEQLQDVVKFYGKQVTFTKVFKARANDREGPALSILSGIPEYVSHQDSLYIHLSDFVAPVGAISLITPDSIATFPVEDQSRWCMVDSQFNLYDKPKIRINHAQAVAGLYHLSDARTFKDVGFACQGLGIGEFQISELLEPYHAINPMETVEVPKSAIKDFGTIEEFIANRGISKTRSFNSISVNGNFVTKMSSENPQKLNSEYHWYQSIPMSVQQYTPKIYRRETTGYTMEKLLSMNLRDLYLYMDRSSETWREVFSAIAEFVEVCQRSYIPNPTDSFWESVISKNYERVSKLTPAQQQEAAPWLEKFHEQLRASAHYGMKSVYHGDLHFANMFYCFHYKQLKVIDPNGQLLGHWLYDLAKLNHSVNGKYDWIDAELYNGIEFMDRGIENVQIEFDKFLGKVGLKSVADRDLLQNLTASLFLTMIPLHTHSTKNQELFFAEWQRMKT